MGNRTWNIKICDECPSTNAVLKEMVLRSGNSDRTALMTNFQTNGRGQGQNTWHSSKGENLLCSVYLKVDLPVADHFLLNIAVSLSIYQLLRKMGVESAVKWPNDIYLGDEKVAGILIENTLMRSEISNTIIGIGLNVNEISFPKWIPNPCSIRNKTIKPVDINVLFQDLLEELEKSFDKLANFPEDLFHTYQTLLYRRNQWHLFKLNEQVLNGRIHGVERDGRLLIEFDNGQLKHFLFGDIQYVI